MITELINAEGFVPYQAKMCHYNKPKALVEFDYVHEVDHIKFFFDVEESASISAYFVKNKFELEAFDGLLEGLRQALLACSDYLLEPGSLRFDIEYIYRSADVHYQFMYIPIREKSGAKLPNQLQALMNQLQGLLDEENQDAMMKLHQIRLSLTADVFDLDDFIATVLTTHLGLVR